jgi:hypothetical protein
VLRELADLREEGAGLAAGLARARYRRAAGLPSESPLREILKAHKLASSSEGLAQAREALQDAHAEEPKRPGRIARLESLRDFLARARAAALEPGAAQELFELPQRPLVRPPGDAGLQGARPAVQIVRQIPLERSREKRGQLEAALAAALQPADATRSAAWDAARSAQEEAAIAVPDDAKAWAEKALEATDAVAQDLGGWLLERHTGATPGNRARHDLLHLLHAPRCASAFPAGEMQRTVRRWVEMLKLDLSAVRLDDEDRPLKWPGACAEPLDPPYEAGLTFLPAEGPRALGALLGAIGAALLRLGPPADAPPEDLWLGDPTVRSACMALLEGLVRDREWLRRCAKVQLSRDDERAIGIAAVFDARIAAARTLAGLQAHESGLGSRAAAAHREHYARATGADLPTGLALCDLDPWFEPLSELKGRALGARARAFLRESHDEDWWRNPRSAASLSGLWGRGGRPRGAELWAEMGGEPELTPLLTELSDSTR